MGQEHESPIELFFSYSHEDEELRDQLANHLRLLERQGVIHSWHDRRIVAGAEWGKAIDEHLESARIILLLVSPDFIASEYCFDKEVTRAMERHESGEAVVIPIILRPTDHWSSAPFGKLQGLPMDVRPITLWRNRDEAFADVARGIRELIQGTDKTRPQLPARSPRLNVTLTVQKDVWLVEASGVRRYEKANPLADRTFVRDIERLRKLDHKPVPTDERGSPTSEGAEAVAGIQSLARSVGERLTKALLADELAESLQRAIARAAGKEQAHLHLIVKPDDAADPHGAHEVLALPWELLRLSHEFPVEKGKLDVSREAYVEGMTGLVQASAELKVVAVVAAPTDATMLNHEEESFRIWRALGENEDLLEVTDLGTVAEFLNAVKKHSPPVVHFTGHGTPGHLLFETETAESHLVDVDNLVTKLRAQATFPRLLYLACCYGATTGRDISASPVGTRKTEKGPKMVDPALVERPSPATAATLHREGIHQILGYFGPVGDLQATQVSEAFYESLAKGENALAAVRNAREQAKEPLTDGGRATHRYPLGWAQIAFYQRGLVTQTALRPTGTRKTKRLDHVRRAEAVAERVDRLRLGFVGRRRERAEMLRRWKFGERCLVVHGLGGLGKTALCTEMAPLLAERVFENRSVSLLTLSGKAAFEAGKKARRDKQVLLHLWEQVANRHTDEAWQQCVAEHQEEGLTGEALARLIQALTEREQGLIVYLDDAESLQKPLDRVAQSKTQVVGDWIHKELERWWVCLCIAVQEREDLGVLASSRYLPKGTPEDAGLPLGKLTNFELVKMMSWFPRLNQLSSTQARRVAERLDGHPRTVEYLDGLVGTEKKAVLGEDEDPDQVPWWAELLSQKLAADLLLSKLLDAIPQEARDHLGRCAYVLEPVPQEALEALEPQEEKRWTAELLGLGLLSPEGKSSTPKWAPHRLVADEGKKRWDGDETQVYLGLHCWFEEKWKHGGNRAEDLFSAASYALAAKEAPKAWPNVDRICSHFRQSGRYREAYEWARRMEDLPLADSEAILVQQELGILGYHLGDIRRAKQHNEAALDLRQRILGEEHPDTLTSMNNLASTLRQKGDLQGARELQEKELEICRRILGEEHPDTLISMGNLASTLVMQGDLQGARELEEKVLQSRQRILGEEHPHTLTSMGNIAQTLRQQGDLQGARELEEKVLQSRQRIQGEEHPDTLTSMNNLAQTLSQQGDLQGARELEEKVLQSRQRILEEEHPDTLISMGNLASTLRQQGDLQGARELEEKVLQSRQRILGEEHPDTLISMGNLASTLRQQGDLQGACELEEKVLQSMQRILGEEHPHTLTSMNNFAGTLMEQGDLQRARSLLLGCIRGRGRVLGTEHPDFQSACGNYVALLQELYPDEEEQSYVQRLLEDLKSS